MADFQIRARSPLRAAAEQKITRVAPILAGHSEDWGGVKDPPEDYASFAQAYRQISWVYKCVSTIAEDCASVPLDVLQRALKGDEADEVDANDSDCATLLRFANKFETFSDLIAKTATHLQITGNAYWGLERATKGGKPAEIWALRPDRVKVEPSKEHYIKGYKYGEGESAKHFEPEDIVHFKLPNPDDDHYGVGPMSPANYAVIMEYYSTAYNHALLRRTGTPGMVMAFKGHMNEDQKKNVQRLWEQRHQGPANAGKLLIVEGGETDLKPFGFNPEQLQIQELRKMSREEIGTCFGVPPVILGLYKEVNYATAGQQEIQYWRKTVIPYLVKFQSAISEFLCPQFDPRLFARFDTRGIEALQVDKTAEAERIEGLVDRGIITPNEARNELGYEGEVAGGDAIFKPMNMVPVESIGAESDASDGEKYIERHAQLYAPGNGNGNGVAATAYQEMASDLVDHLPEGALE